MPTDAGRRYDLLLATSMDLVSSLDLSEILQSAARRLSEALDIPDCDIYRVDGDRIVCVAATIDGVYDASWVTRELRLADRPCEREALETRRAVAVRDLDDPRLSAETRAGMTGYGQRSFVALPLVAHDDLIGVVDLLDHREREFTPEELAVAEAVGQLVALALERARLHEKVRDLHLANLRALASTVGARDSYTLGHAGRVAGYLVMLGRELGWTGDRLEAVENAALLHDIGKLGVSDRVLLKPGPLTTEEWELMREHPATSAEIVRPLFDEALVAGVRHHHERFDGGGYPDGLAGAAIPEVARALCVVDSYDAMSSWHPYRRALSYRRCLAELRRCSGTQFDPPMVEAFQRVLQGLQRQQTRLARLAEQAVPLIDPDAHALLSTRADEERPEYLAMAGALREFRDDNPPLRFVRTFAARGSGCIRVLDASESENDASHCGDPWLPSDALERALVGESLTTNVLTADDYGVRVSGIAAVPGDDGRPAAAVVVSVPAVNTLDPEAPGTRGRALTAMLQTTTMRYRRAAVEAITDGLTGLYNHRYLHERLEEELERACRRDARLSLLFCDCDKFKAYNDTYGHRAGDEVLARVAGILQAGVRRSDLAARYGGEEFVLVLIDTDGPDARRIAETLRREIEEANARAGRPLTVSIGVATSPGDATSHDELIDKADWAMYAAKRAGRNRVAAFSDGLVAPTPV